MKNSTFYKRVIMLTFCLVLALQSFAYADSSVEDIASKNLVNLKIMQGYEDGSLRLQNKIKRSEFVTLIVKMLGYDQNTDLDTMELEFKDVSNKSWYTKYIKAAVHHKLVLGNSKNKFNPESNITYSEALTVLIRSLGYEDTLIGKWPDNILAKSTELGLDKDLSLERNQQITRGEMAIIINNSLLIDLRWGLNAAR